ncbi:MAG: xanthine phosphoribosyltransferase [Treponema sp.]|nr:xanthine phosphoribosyltransferase [Candidatus Treponema equifaecale]
MNFLEERICKDGIVKPGNVLKVDSFLNHQIDIDLLDMMGKEFKERFSNEKITKILTIEASGIGMACMTARYFGVPVVFAKKSQTVVQDDDKYIADVASYTHKVTNHVFVSKKYICPEDKVLIIDDFMAHGQAALGLIDIVKQAGGSVVGVGIAIEKGFQQGGQILRDRGYKLESIAIVESMDPETGKIEFRKQ